MLINFKISSLPERNPSHLAQYNLKFYSPCQRSVYSSGFLANPINSNWTHPSSSLTLTQLTGTSRGWVSEVIFPRFPIIVFFAFNMTQFCVIWEAYHFYIFSAVWTHTWAYGMKTILLRGCFFICLTQSSQFFIPRSTSLSTVSTDCAEMM